MPSACPMMPACPPWSCCFPLPPLFLGQDLTGPVWIRSWKVGRSTISSRMQCVVGAVLTQPASPGSIPPFHLSPGILLTASHAAGRLQVCIYCPERTLQDWQTQVGPLAGSVGLYRVSVCCEGFHMNIVKVLSCEDGLWRLTAPLIKPSQFPAPV